jgi:hypothetical protein
MNVGTALKQESCNVDTVVLRGTVKSCKSIIRLSMNVGTALKQ